MITRWPRVLRTSRRRSRKCSSDSVRPKTLPYPYLRPVTSAAMGPLRAVDTADKGAARCRVCSACRVDLGCAWSFMRRTRATSESPAKFAWRFAKDTRLTSSQCASLGSLVMSSATAFGLPASLSIGVVRAYRLSPGSASVHGDGDSQGRRPHDAPPVRRGPSSQPAGLPDFGVHVTALARRESRS